MLCMYKVRYVAKFQNEKGVMLPSQNRLLYDIDNLEEIKILDLCFLFKKITI